MMERPGTARRGHGSFQRAVELLRAGDIAALGALLTDEPELVTARASLDTRPYDGYFNGATLLHHVPGNPAPAPPAQAVLPMARLLIEAGAQVDALTRAGPSQPNDIGWTALGLAATSGELDVTTVQLPLLDLLLEHGADPDAPGGGALKGALYYGQSAAAAHLASRGARLDLVAAAGVGELEALAAELALGPAAIAARPRLAHYSRVPWPEHPGVEDEVADLLALALLHAALHGRVRALGLLIEAGADPNRRAPFDHQGTALHWAVMGDHPEAVSVLLEAGADTRIKDLEHHSTPAGWAAHMGRPRAAAALPGPGPR